MNLKAAKKIAIEAMKRERQTIAVDANIVKLTGNGSPHMKKAANRYQELTQAIEIIQSLPESMF